MLKIRNVEMRNVENVCREPKRSASQHARHSNRTGKYIKHTEVEDGGRIRAADITPIKQTSVALQDSRSRAQARLRLPEIDFLPVRSQA
jgi:hypothetical protein